MWSLGLGGGSILEPRWDLRKFSTANVARVGQGTRGSAGWQAEVLAEVSMSSFPTTRATASVITLGLF